MKRLEQLAKLQQPQNWDIIIIGAMLGAFLIWLFLDLVVSQRPLCYYRR